MKKQANSKENEIRKVAMKMTLQLSALAFLITMGGCLIISKFFYTTLKEIIIFAVFSTLATSIWGYYDFKKVVEAELTFKEERKDSK